MKAMIPGWGFSAGIWKDSPWYGGGDILLDYPSLEDITIESIAEHFASKIQEETTIVGWSLGGLIAIKMASMFPEKVKALKLVSSTPRFLEADGWAGITKQTEKYFIEKSKKDFNALFKEFLMLVNYPSRRLANKYAIDVEKNKCSLIDYLRLLFSTDLREEYAKIKIPIAHVASKLDAVLKVDYDALLKLNSNIKVEMADAEGHAFFLRMI